MVQVKMMDTMLNSLKEEFPSFDPSQHSHHQKTKSSFYQINYRLPNKLIVRSLLLSEDDTSIYVKLLLSSLTSVYAMTKEIMFLMLLAFKQACTHVLRNCLKLPLSSIRPSGRSASDIVWKVPEAIFYMFDF